MRTREIKRARDVRYGTPSSRMPSESRACEVYAHGRDCLPFAEITRNLLRRITTQYIYEWFSLELLSFFIFSAKLCAALCKN